MPYSYAANLLLWPVSCKTVSVSTSQLISAGSADNCFILLLSGKVDIVYEAKTCPLEMESIAVMGRNISITVEKKGDHPCQLLLLRLATVDKPPYIDLNHLCLTIPMIDSFFTYKERFCILKDKENIRFTLNAILSEIYERKPEWEQMVIVKLQEFLIYLARSFYAHDHITGIQLLSTAREYIRNHYREILTVDQIASCVGISRSYLAQLFATHLQYSTVDYIQAVRCDHAAYLLRTTRFTILDIALEVGFNSRQHFARTFAKIYEITPSQYRKTQLIINDKKIHK